MLCLNFRNNNNRYSGYRGRSSCKWHKRKGDHEMKKKLNVQFIEHNEPFDEVVSNALMTQLMVTITQIGIRMDNSDVSSKIGKETKHVKE